MLLAHWAGHLNMEESLMGTRKINEFPYLTEFAEQAEGDEPKVEVPEAEATEETDAGGEIEVVIPEDLSELDDEALQGIHSSTVEAFTALYGEDGSGLTDDDLQSLSMLTTGIERIKTEMAKREEEASKRAEEASQLARRVNPDAFSDEEAEAPAEPEAEAEPEAPKETGQTLRINLSGLRGRQAAPPSREEKAPEVEGPKGMKDIVHAAPDLQGFSVGQGIDWSDMGRALDRRLQSFNRTPWDQANAQGRHLSTQLSVAQITKPFAADMILEGNDPVQMDAILQHARNEKRLKGNSLVAAGGWCAPSETKYDLLELESRDGLYSLPEINVARGGIRYTPGPNFADIYANSGFTYTEAEDIAGDYDGDGGGTKPCYKVECPDFTEVRLGYSGVCITAGLLQQRGYPEVIARTVRGALVAHDMRLSASVLNAVVTGSDAVSMPGGQVGAVAPILTAIEVQVEHYRTVNRLDRGAALEAVFPFWVRGAIRADLSRRQGLSLLSVSDAQVDTWFRERGINPQYVYGLDDFSGAASTATSFPEAVRFVLYGAGTWVRGSSDIITLDTLYDSVKLGTNDYTALFTEEGWLVANMGHDSRVVTVPICADGATHMGVDIACDGSLEASGV